MYTGATHADVITRVCNVMVIMVTCYYTPPYIDTLMCNTLIVSPISV